MGADMHLSDGGLSSSVRQRETLTLDIHMFHWETKGRFRKRVVLANVPSFLFSFRGNTRTYPRSCFRSGGTSECTLVLVFVPGEHPSKPPFWKTTLLSTPETLLPADARRENQKIATYATSA